MTTFPTLAKAQIYTKARLDQRSLDLRARILDTMARAGRGHLAPALSVVEIIRVLYDHILKYDPKRPDWPDRDRFILSKGHGCLALYMVMAEKGFFPESELAKFCAGDGILGGHPEYGRIPGVECSTGSLGHGMSIGVGFALSARYDRSDRRVFVVVGDGECNEGSVWEAALSAGKYGLSNLTVIIDYNKQQSYGPTAEIQDLEPLADKWIAFGFNVREVDGHDVEALQDVLSGLPVSDDKPNLIIAHTIKGRGIGQVEANLKWHHKSGFKDRDRLALIKDLRS